MKNSIKGSVMVAALVMMGTTTVLANADVVTGGEHSVRVEGTIEPKVVTLSLPTSFSFNIDPNESSGNYFSASEYTITNRSDVPLKVSVSKFESAKDAGVYQFTDVLPTAHQDWYGLSEELTMRDLALGLKVVNPSEWIGDVRTETIWAKEVQESADPIEIGVMPDQTGSVRLTLEAKHGLKFSKRIAPAYDISLFFEFVDGSTPS